MVPHPKIEHVCILRCLVGLSCRYSSIRRLRLNLLTWRQILFPLPLHTNQRVDARPCSQECRSPLRHDAIFYFSTEQPGIGSSESPGRLFGSWLTSAANSWRGTISSSTSSSSSSQHLAFDPQPPHQVAPGSIVAVQLACISLGVQRSVQVVSLCLVQ